MRRILIENARRKATAKRGGDWEKAAFTTDEIAVDDGVAQVDLLALDEALLRLEAEDPQAAMLVKLRYFSGLTVAQSAEILDVSTRTAERLWTYAKAWLYRELQ